MEIISAHLKWSSNIISLYQPKDKLIVLLLCCCLNVGLFAQNPYELSLEKDLTILGISTIGQISAVYMAGRLKPLTDAEIGLLNPNTINSFDRKATSYYSVRQQKKSDIILQTAYFFPALFLLDDKGRKGFLEIGVLAGEAFMVNATITALTKLTRQRIRPLAYNPEVPIEERKKAGVKVSFFSGHTSAVTVLSFFSAKVYSDYYPDSKWKPVVWTVASILPAATGYYRVKGGKHFPTDVMVGYAVGALIGVGIPHIHRKKNKDKQGLTLSVLTGIDALGLRLNW